MIYWLLYAVVVKWVDLLYGGQKLWHAWRFFRLVNQHLPHILTLQPSHSRFWSLHLWLHISHPPLSSVGIWSHSALLSLLPDRRSNPRSAHCLRKGRHSSSALHMELPAGQTHKQRTLLSSRSGDYNLKGCIRNKAFTTGWQIFVNTRRHWSTATEHQTPAASCYLFVYIIFFCVPAATEHRKHN